MQTNAAIRTVHVGPAGRIRYAVPKLHRDPQLVRELERTLGSYPGVREVRGNARTATLLVVFDPNEPHRAWQTSLAHLLGASGAPREPPAERASGRALGLLHALREEHVLSQREPKRRRQRAAGPSEEDTTPWHTFELEDVLARLTGSEHGLSASDADERLARDGHNMIEPPQRRSELRIFADQLVSTPVIMLGASAVASAAMGGFGDAAAIGAVIATNASIGYVTESSAERTIAALTHTPQDAVPALRDALEVPLAVEDVVRGDVLMLRAGVFIAADARILSAHDLTVDESSLTGESIPVQKVRAVLADAATALADRTNMVFRGTLVTGGSGAAIVVATGPRTQLGHIQQLAGGIEQRETPLQRQLERLGQQLAIGAGVACLGVLGVGLLRGQALLPLLRTAVSLAVAAVPEGLPTVAMTTLALGLSRMREERVLVRTLAAVETLGATQVVCLDKTGTLTVNRMTVVALATTALRCDVAHGSFRRDDGGAHPKDADIEQLLRIAVLCNEVELEHREAAVVLRGSPTEGALVQLALDAGLAVEQLRTELPLRSVQRRAQARNYMSTFHAGTAGRLLAVKGRPSEVLALCTQVIEGGQPHPLDDATRASIETENERMAGRALRVLGFAMLPDAIDCEPRGELVWAGLIGMEDPPRESVPDVLARLHRAGMRTIMITGDQSATAQAVGRQVGLGSAGKLEIVDSTRLDELSPEVLATLARRADVFSRVSPSHKLQIVRALQQAGMVVAMTGDGVNDGPALKAADVGIAMGAGGTAAARELADVVLEDDELRTLIAAVEQGRTIYDDIRKAVHFILATNFSELAFTFACVAAGIGEPLTPIQLLWINLLTDIFPELALAVQPAAADVMTRPPRDPHRPMFTRSDLLRIGVEGGAITLGALGAYFSTARGLATSPRAGSVGFTTLMFAQLLHAYSARDEVLSIYDRRRIATSRWLPIAIGGTAAAQLMVSLLPPIRTFLGVVPMTLGEWGRSFAGALLPFLFNEGTKFVLHGGRANTLTVPAQAE